MQKHFVTFYSPGTFGAEISECPIESWNTELAMDIARGVKERLGAVPYGFQFTTRERGETDLDSKMVAESPMYFLGGIIETLEQVKARAMKEDNILLGNMEGNGYKRIITNTNSWRWTQPLKDTDVVMDWHQQATDD